MSESKQEHDRRQAFDPSRLPRSTLRRDGFVAEIIQDRRAAHPLYECVIQREGSSDVLFYAQFTSLEAAKGWAIKELRDYVTRAA